MKPRPAVVGGVAVALLALVMSAGAAHGEERAIGDPNKPNTSQAARDNAVRAIPYSKLSRDAQAKVSWVLANTSLFRRLPICVNASDPDVYQFLIEHPEVVVNIWELMGVARLKMERTAADQYEVADGAGTTARLQYLFRSPTAHLAYFSGAYKGGFFGRQITMRGLLLLTSGYASDGEGRCYVTSRLDTFVNVEPGGAEFLTKTFQPAIGKVVDANFVQTAGFLASVTRAAERNPDGVQRLAGKLTRVAAEVRREFAEVAATAAQRADALADAEQLAEAQRQEAAARVARRDAAMPHGIAPNRLPPARQGGASE